MSSSGTGRAPLRWFLLIVLALAACGVVLGLARAAGEIQRHGYLALGFRRALLIVPTEETTRFGLLGAAFGLACVVAQLAGRALVEISRRFGTGGARPDRTWPYAACLSVALLVVTIYARMHGIVSPTRMLGTIVAAALWCAVLFFWRSVRPGPRNPAGFLARALFVALYGLPAVLIPALLASKEALPEFERAELAVAAVPLAILLALVVRRHPLPSSTRGTTPVPGSAWSVAAVAAIPIALHILAAAGTWPPSTYEARRPFNLVVILIDTLRLDHTSLLAEPSADAGDAPPARDLTPNLRELAGGGSVFTTAVSQAPWTMPAFASIVTGKYPRQHGATSLFGALPRREVTLPEVLREAAYRTGGVVSHVYVDSDHGFAQGFDEFHDEDALGHRTISSDDVTDKAIAFVERQSSERPFFLLAHYFDPHYEYLDHAEWSDADDYDGWLRDRPLDIRHLRLHRHLLDSEDVGYLRDLYAEEIRATDREIGRLAALLRERQLLENTVIVVVADHGEEFLEHGWLGHTITLHDEVIRVPMLVRVPGTTSRPVVRRPVETRALFSTLIECLGIDHEVPDEEANLLPAMGVSFDSTPPTTEPGDEPSRHATFSEVWLSGTRLPGDKQARMSCIRTDDWKLIIDHTRGRVQAFDLGEDPGERQVLPPEPTSPAGALVAELGDWLVAMEGGAAPAPDQEPSAELLRQLESLGYVSGGTGK